MSILLQIFFIILLIFGYVYWSMQRWKNRIFAGLKPLKEPPSYPIIGCALAVLPASTAMWTLMSFVKTYRTPTHKSYKASMPFSAGIVTMDPEFVEIVMTSTATLNKGIIYRFLNNWLGDGLLLSSSGKWHKRRKMLTPAFHFNILKQFIPIFEKNDKILIENLKTASQKGPVDVMHYVTLSALDNINETAMGTCKNAQLHENSDYVQAIETLKKMAYERGVSLIKFNDYLFALTPHRQLEKKYLKIVHEYTMSVIKSRREQLLNSSENVNKNNEDFGIKKRTAFLDVLLQSTIDGQLLTDEEIREEVDTFMFEGHDTVSSGISFALHCISQHPDVQQKIINEQNEILGANPEREITIEDYKAMSYLEMVIKESLRLYPSVPLLSRLVTEDFIYKDLKIVKGTEIGVLIYEINRDPDTYPEPEKFIPERFTPEMQSKRHPFAYLPFSAGHRNCIGQKFAMLEMKSTLGRVLRNFELAPTNPPHQIHMPSDIVLSSSNGVKMIMQKRN